MPDLFLELAGSEDAIATDERIKTEEDALSLLIESEISAANLIPWGSNYSFAVALHHEQFGTHLGIYKPRAGEAPLHDFPSGTLFKREIAAYLLSSWLGWNLVPATVVHDGPHGTGSLQLYVQPVDREIDHDEQWGAPTFINEQLVLFDHIANNADRKLSHFLLAMDGKSWGIDHGLTFNAVPKLRTVQWQFAGDRIRPELLKDLDRLVTELGQITGILEPWLNEEEIDAFQSRVQRLKEKRCYPRLDPYRNIPYGWW